jgi:hypothetical protein
LWLAWCWFWFSSIPFSVRNGGVFVLAGAVGGKVKISGVFSDLKMSVGAVFFAGGMCFFSFFLSAAVQARDCGDCGDSGVLCATVVGLVLVLGSLPFHSIPSVSAAEELVFWLAGAVGGKARISGVFVLVIVDVVMLVDAVFFAGGLLSFVLSFFPLVLLLPRGSILVRSEVCV